MNVNDIARLCHGTSKLLFINPFSLFHKSPEGMNTVFYPLCSMTIHPGNTLFECIYNEM